MLRFIHTSDWHLTQGKFFEETLRCLEFIADVGQREDVDAFLLPGDLTHCDLPHRVMQPIERDGLASVLMRMRDRAAVWLTHGNHDIEGDLAPFGWLAGVGSTRFGVDIDAASPLRREPFQLLSVPYPHKRHWLARREAGPIEDQRQELGVTIGGALRALAQQRRPDVPLIGLAHINIAGSKLGGGEVMIGQEIELTPADLDEIGCDYWALGHIHSPQQVAGKARYCGTPQPHSFGDSNVNGFNLVEIDGPGATPRVTFIETPAVKLYTARAGWTGTQWSFEDLGAVLTPCHLRVVATVDEAERERVDWEKLERVSAMQGAAVVRIERRIIPTTRVRSEAIRAAHTVEEKLRTFWTTLEPNPAPADQQAALGELGVA